MDRNELIQKAQNGSLSGAILLEGTEENLKSTALEAVRQALLPPGMEQLNETVLDAPASDAVIAAAETLPFLADRRLVIVRDHPGLTGRGEGDDRLTQYITDVPDTCVLIFFVRGKADARKKLYTAIKKHGQIVTVNTLDDAALNQWIISAFAAQGKKCSPQTASLLAFTVGSTTALLTQEIDKLCALSGERTAVSDDDVRAIATRSIECTVFEMVDAVVAGKEGRAFQLLKDMLTRGESRLGILAMLLRQFRLMQHTKIMQFEKRSPQEIRSALGVPPFAADRIIRQASGYTGGQVKRAVDICLQEEANVKSGKHHDEGSLEAAMLEIFALRR